MPCRFRVGIIGQHPAALYGYAPPTSSFSMLFWWMFAFDDVDLHSCQQSYIESLDQFVFWADGVVGACHFIVLVLDVLTAQCQEVALSQAHCLWGGRPFEAGTGVSCCSRCVGLTEPALLLVASKRVDGMPKSASICFLI